MLSPLRGAHLLHAWNNRDRTRRWENRIGSRRRYSANLAVSPHPSALRARARLAIDGTDQSNALLLILLASPYHE